MAIHVALNHRTRYTYDRLVGHSPHVIRLRPAPHARTPILSYSLNITPEKHFINWQQDPHGNHLARVVFPDPMRALCIEVDLVAEMSVYNPFDFFLEADAGQFPFTYDAALKKELIPFLEVTEKGRAFDRLFAEFHGLKQPTVDYLVYLNRSVQTRVRYVIRLEPGVQTPEETLTLGQGSCRDSAWLLVQLARRLGLAARFVSGYLIQLAPDVKSLDGPSGVASDFTDLHAWTEVYLPGAGWIGLDPTSGLLAGEGHIPLVCTPAPMNAAPVTGGVDACESKLEHTMRVTRIRETPRVTKPYTEAQWAELNRVGLEVDKRMAQADVRLTMGGEPTFVSIDDMDGAEWNTAALGARKRVLAGELIKRLRAQFCPGGLLFHGQGKWYPGEALPRWALSCHWRRDGEPIWHDDRLIADENIDYHYGLQEAERLSQELAVELGLETRFIMPAFEDVWHYLWKERRLPANVDPFDSKLENPEDRARLARIFERGLDKTVGFVLPLRKETDPNAKARWQSGRWFLRTERLYLIPGDSPIGLRLPLDSMPWMSAMDAVGYGPQDPTQPRPPLPSRASIVAQIRDLPGAALGQGQATSPEAIPANGVSATDVVRTALCVEARDGRLHLFIPPITSVEDYLELLAAIEATVRRLGLPVLLEGAPPPTDARLNCIRVTPDPGVIEVNLHPAHNWEELTHNIQTLYSEARLARLGTEKFMLDGRHTGTGGGNHMVMGGATPADSPLLRRPDLLRSLLGYWQNHPALSYLFSGLFIGPTSQHPRVDEARNDALDELEIAFQKVPENTAVAPWLVDRLFRHLLADVSGNTHRAEFSIDKLYSPDSSTGRLGLLELRSFEMPPHARMSLAQHLLLRALLVAFWEQPYTQPLARWGTDLHDRFLLPHFVWQDLRDVIQDLHTAGYALQEDWFAPHFEFRFPLIGALTLRGVHLELRQALEPWPVLGEEWGGGGTVRNVDSSLERLQIKVQGMTGGRFAVACNGRRVPLRPTGVQGEYVAGVRYRAWQPPSCLHPTIGVHSPLVIDLADTWSGRAIGGCTCHVMHPGGRSYDTFPVNAFEAESRRLSRFFPSGHTPGPFTIPEAETHPSFPFTLDLRRDG
jgi:uncharacterized protein (DUF2126 family)